MTKQCLVAIALLASSVAFANNGKLARDLEGRHSSTKVDVIIQFIPGSNGKAPDVSLNGGMQKRLFSRVNQMLAEVPVAALPALANNPNITYISPDRAIERNLEYANPTVGADIAFNY